MVGKQDVDVLVLFGEKSGEIQAKHLIESLLCELPTITIASLYTQSMAHLPLEFILDSSYFHIMGAFDVLSKLPTLFKARHQLETWIHTHNPRTLVTIDFPDFHLHLIKRLRKRGFCGKIIHHVCPSIWAWRHQRKKTLESYLDHLSCILPFEPHLFQNSSLPVTFTGHPLASCLIEKTQQFPQKEPLLLLFPGSREKEIQRIFPLMDRVIDPSLAWEKVVCVSDSKLLATLQKIPTKNTFRFAHETQRYDLMKRASLALAKLGTVNIELAVFEVPTIALYRMNWLDTFLAHHIFKIHLPFYSLVNITAGKMIFPEFVGPMIKEKSLRHLVQRMVEDASIRKWIQKDLQQFKEIFFTPAPSSLSRIILDSLDN